MASNPKKTTKLTAWQIVAVVHAVHKAIENCDIEKVSGKLLLEALEDASEICVKTV